MNVKITVAMMLIYLLGSADAVTIVAALLIGAITYTWCRCVDWLVSLGYKMP